MIPAGLCDEGVLLSATGARHRREAELAASRIRPHLRGRPLWLVTDAPADIAVDCFDRIIQHPDVHGSYRDKIPPLLNLPFRRTVFLDTDVELLQPIDDVFSLLMEVDLVGCHAPVRWSQWRDPQVPDGLTELNSGVLGLRRGRRCRHFVRRWLRTYDEAAVPFDQASLRSALWWGIRRGLRTWVLPPEYNLRTTKPWVAGPGLAVKVLHGRIPDSMREPLRRYLNDDITTFRSSSAFPTRQNAAVALPSPSQPPSHRLFILGAGRSGTSLVAGLFRHHDLFMGDALHRPREANPLGFFEDREINAINEALLQPHVPDVFADGQRWLATLADDRAVRSSPGLDRRIRNLYARGAFCFKDPRFCYTLAAWRDLLTSDEQQVARYICVFRDPSAVLASTSAELTTAPYLRGLQVSAVELEANWLALYRSVLNQHVSHGRWLFVPHESLFGADRRGLDRLEAFTGLELDRSFVQPHLHRQRGGEPVSAACRELYDHLLQLSRTNP